MIVIYSLILFMMFHGPLSAGNSTYDTACGMTYTPYILQEAGLPNGGRNHLKNSSHTHDTLSFVLTASNNLILTAVLNEQDTLSLMFHTAASGVTLTKKATAHLESMDWARSDTVYSWGSESTARYSPLNSLQIGNLRWDKVGIWENDLSGPGSVGKFGPGLFEGKIIEVNFDENMIVLHTHIPEGISGYQKMPITVERGLIYVDGTCLIKGRHLSNKFLIHTGYGGALLLDDNFVHKNRLDTLLHILSESQLKNSFGDIIKTQKSLLPEFEIGNNSLKEVPVAFFEGALDRQKISVIGGDLLKRFNMFIDLKSLHMHIRTNRNMHNSFSDL